MGEAKRRAQYRAEQAAVAAYVALKQRQRAAAAKGVATKKAKAEAAAKRSEAAKKAAETRRINQGFYAPKTDAVVAAAKALGLTVVNVPLSQV